MTTTEAYEHILKSQDFGTDKRFVECVEAFSQYRENLSHKQNTKMLQAILLLLADEANETLGKCPGNLFVWVSRRFGNVYVSLTPSRFLCWKEISSQRWKISSDADILCYRKCILSRASNYAYRGSDYIIPALLQLFRELFSDALAQEKAAQLFEVATKRL
jgi:hypothetical protein